MDDLLQKLVEWMQTASPQLWAVLIKQVYTRAVVDGVWVIALVVFVVVSRRAHAAWYKEHKNDYSADVVSIIMWVAWVSAVLGCAVLVSDVVFILLNPEYQAIQLILSQLK